MNQLKKYAEVVSWIALLAILVVMALPLFHIDFRITRWVYTFAAPLYLLARLTEYSGLNPEMPLRAKRLCRLGLWSGLFFCAAVVMMWVRTVGESDWVAFTLAGAVIIILVNFMLPRALKQKR